MTEQRAVDAVLARIESAGLTKAELGRATGMSFKTIQRLVDERVLPTRGDKRRDLALGLQWPADAIDRILDGEDPASFPDTDHLLDGVNGDPVLSALRELTDRVAGLEQLLRQAGSSEDGR